MRIGDRQLFGTCIWPLRAFEGPTAGVVGVPRRSVKVLGTFMEFPMGVIDAASMLTSSHRIHQCLEQSRPMACSGAGSYADGERHDAISWCRSCLTVRNIIENNDDESVRGWNEYR